jgi:RsiW-degrading membrane proteinase PrsW (M82 family)
VTAGFPPFEPAIAHPGWYPDPWEGSQWRWWDGQAWTAHVAERREHKPVLPSWLSLPVLVGALFITPIVVYVAVIQPVAILLGLVPLAIVFPTLAWLDRVEPEPRSSRIHAVLWGATIAGLVAVVVNTAVGVAAGEVASTVISAPLVEEAAKGLGVYWALRRREIDSVMDGIVYAGWTALGFAVVEDFTYFERAATEGFLVPVFILRGLLTPFAHPLFTSWIGLAVGLAVVRQQSVALNAVWGYGLAVASHAAWNGSITYAEETGDDGALVIAALCFVGLFVAAVVTVVMIRRHQQQRFVASVPMLANRYGVSHDEARAFAHWRTMLMSRRRLPRRERVHFDALHAALARLAFLHSRPGPIDPADEKRLVDQLHRARSARALG